jgi:hypothetical protein
LSFYYFAARLFAGPLATSRMKPQMAVKIKKMQTMMESFVREEDNPVRGRLRFVREIHDSLGITRDRYDRPVLRSDRMEPEEYGIRPLAEAICGHDFVEEYFNPNSGPDMLTLLESGPGLDPTAMLNINTFSLAVAGLVMAQIIKKFNNPAFIGDQLVEIKQTKKNGDKLISTTNIGNKSRTRGIGEPHPRAAFGEQWVKTPETTEQALSVEVTQEAVFYDLTGDVLDTAGGVGKELGYARELAILSMVLGITNSYNYKDTAYNTYQTATPWINQKTNLFVDWTSIDVARAMFVGMTDPATGKRILITPTTILCDDAARGLIGHTLRQTYYEERTDRGADVGVRVTGGGSPLEALLPGLKMLSSPLTTDLWTSNGVSAANAAKRWFLGDPTEAFAWMENWPLRVRQASATEFVMMDRGLIAAFFANYRGKEATKEPRYMALNTE